LNAEARESREIATCLASVAHARSAGPSSAAAACRRSKPESLGLYEATALRTSCREALAIRGCGSPSVARA
jgi:hypothetical protein